MISRHISEFLLAAGAAVVVGRPDLCPLHGPDEGERSSGGGPCHPAVVIGQNPQNQQCSNKLQYANHLGPKSEQRLFDSADFWGVFNSKGQILLNKCPQIFFVCHDN